MPSVEPLSQGRPICHSEGGAAPERLSHHIMAPTEESSVGLLVARRSRATLGVTLPPRSRQTKDYG